MSQSAAGTISAANAVETVITLTPCTTLVVRVEENSAAPLEVNLPQLHGDDWYTIRPKEVEYFRYGFAELRTLKVRGSGGTATGRYAVVSQTTFHQQ